MRPAGHQEPPAPQRVLVLQQHGSARAKIAGIRRYAPELIRLEVISIDRPLPPVIDDTAPYLPERLTADLVLDFLRHPDLSTDLAARCARQGLPVVASGRRIPGALGPPT